MKKLALVLLLVPGLSLAQEAPKTVEMPSALMQEVMQFLSMDRGHIAVSIIRQISDCAANQGSVQIHMANQPDMCPVVTEAIKARTTPTSDDSSKK